MTVLLTHDNKELAKAYDEISDSQFDNGKKIVESLNIKNGDSVLDIGAGTGRLSRYVSEIIGDSGHLIGIDPLEERIRIANEKNTYKNSEYRIGSAEDLSYIEDNSIDIVYLNAVFHWVIDKKKSLKEIHRVLKPGGRVGITTGAKELNSVSGVQKISNSVLSKEPYRKVVDIEKHTLNKHGLTTGELIELIVESGLYVSDIHIRNISWPYKTGEDIVWHSEASSFGNYLSHVPENLRLQAKREIASELEKYRSEDGIVIDRHTIFAIARKK